uniref:biotin/lipoyl-binding protein n=1 Tax=Tanticharoenia sakaeratensis TaxID=444053 RepID=UPI0006622B9B
MRIMPSNLPRLSTRIVVPLALVVVILLGLLAVTVPGYFEASTADAYVDAHIEQISPHVPAYVRTLHVNDNTYVHRGDLLVELDPRDYQAQLAIARANVAAASSRLEDARNRVAVVAAAVREAQSRVEVNEAHVRLAQVSFRRLLAVTDARAVSTQSVDDATAALAAAQADLSASRSVVQEQTAQE